MRRFKFKLGSVDYVDKSILFVLLIPYALLGKLIRYTVLKSTLVDTATGLEWIGSIVRRGNTFTFFPSSYDDNAIFIYEILNFFGLKTYQGFEIYITIICNLLLITMIGMMVRELDFVDFAFISLMIVCLNIFDFCLAKEPIQMCFFILIYLVIRSNASNIAKTIMLAAAFLFCISSLRSYYVLIIIYGGYAYIISRLFLRKDSAVTTRKVIMLVVMIFASNFIMMNILHSVSYDTYYQLLRLRTHRRLAATTNISVLFSQSSTNLVFFSLEYILVLVRLLFPIELLPMGIKYFPYVVLQLFITYYVFRTLRRINSLGYVAKMCLFIYLGFLCTSACFEPDFGSWVRHEAVIFPLLIGMMDIDKKVACNADFTADQDEY